MNSSNSNEILFALKRHKAAFWSVAVFSFVINLLYLTPSIFMMQVYDRVLTSRSEFTLLMFIILAVALYLLMSLMEFARSQVLIRVGNAIDEFLSQRVFVATYENNLLNGLNSSSSPLSDLNNIRQFVTGNGLFAFLDAPWFPIYLVVIFLMHTWLGIFALVGAAILIGLTYLTERLSHEPLKNANQQNILATNFANSNLRNTEVIESMGMLQHLVRYWYRFQVKMLEQQTIASVRASGVSALTKLVRLILQSGTLAIGAILVIDGAASPGIMIAASILVSRTLAPVESLIVNWKNFSAARSAYHRLVRLLMNLPQRPQNMSLPAPEGELLFEKVYASPPGVKVSFIKNLNFKIEAGDVVGLIGLSASGKSSVARLMMGVWNPRSGRVTLDGADIFQWNKDELGPYLGYLPQDIELFNGTVAQNIARFGEVDSEQVIMAAQRAGVHRMILDLPNGYDTVLGESGNFLSGGQRQRIGIARAYYGNPSVIVLDEPNSNLDESGEMALINSLMGMKELGKTIILISHRKNILQVVDKLMVMHDGQVVDYGRRDEVLQRLSGANKRPASVTSDSANGAPNQPSPQSP